MYTPCPSCNSGRVITKNIGKQTGGLIGAAGGAATADRGNKNEAALGGAVGALGGAAIGKSVGGDTGRLIGAGIGSWLAGRLAEAKLDRSR